MRRRRLLLGGSVNNGSGLLRTSFRIWVGPEGRDRDVGFRIVVSRRKP